MRKIYFLSLLLYIMACNGNGCNTGPSPGNEFAPLKNPVGKGLNVADIIAKRDRMIPRTCEIISTADVSAALGIPEVDMYLSDSTPRGTDPDYSACFFKWDNSSISSAGILVHVSRNRIGDEAPGYVVEYINALKTTGESTAEQNAVPDIFKTFGGIGDDGAYSVRSGNYYWRLGDQLIFRLSFNSIHPPLEQYKAAQILASKITKNYIAGK